MAFAQMLSTTWGKNGRHFSDTDIRSGIRICREIATVRITSIAGLTMRSNHLLLTFALSVPMALVTLSCNAQSLKKAYVQLSGSGPIKSTVQLDDQVPILIGDQLTFRILEDEDPAVTLPVNDSGQ